MNPIEAEVKAHDYDRWLAAQFARPEDRPGLFAVAAFGIETAKIPEVVRDPMLRQIRLAWWRETVERVHAGEIRPHPVVHALAPAIQAGTLPRELFERYFEARAQGMSDEFFGLGADLEAYSAGTAGTLMAMGAHILGAGGRATVAATAAGLAYAYAGLARSLPFHAAQGRLFVPLPWLASEGTNPAAVLAGRDAAAVRRVEARLWAEAGRHLAEARRAWTPAAAAALPALLPAGLTEAYAAAAERNEELGRLKKQVLMLRAALRGRL